MFCIVSRWGPGMYVFRPGIAAFKEAAAAPAAAAWLEQNTAAGLPAQELYDLVTGMIADAM